MTYRSRQTLVHRTYADLSTIIKGRDIARNLVSAIINMQIGPNSSVDALFNALQQRCGSFCSADEALLYKVWRYCSSNIKCADRLTL